MRIHNYLKAFVLLSQFIFTVAQASATSSIRVDGSSTVFPITEAVAEEFGKLHSNVRVVVGESGTGGGFKKFSLGETDINDASRAIKSMEVAKAKEHGVDFIELPIAHDGITVVVNKKNDWVDHLTVTELKKIWEPNSKVKSWKDVRANWPDRKIKLYGPGPDSGTFDFFTEEINGKAQASRSDFTKSEDDNVLVKGVAGDKDSLGYFGYAYFSENEKTLKSVSIENGKGPVSATPQTINNATYSPLSRTIYIYVSKKSLAKPEVKEFVKFYLDKAATLSEEVGYVPLSEVKYKAAKETFEKAIRK